MSIANYIDSPHPPVTRCNWKETRARSVISKLAVGLLVPLFTIQASRADTLSGNPTSELLISLTGMLLIGFPAPFSEKPADRSGGRKTVAYGTRSHIRG